MNVYRAVRRAVKTLRQLAPKDTGNLAYNAIKLKKVDENTYRIYVDERIAPYMKYTNENWDQFRPPLKGKQNPNEGWFDRAAMIVLEQIKTDLNGEIK